MATRRLSNNDCLTTVVWVWKLLSANKKYLLFYNSTLIQRCFFKTISFFTFNFCCFYTDNEATILNAIWQFRYCFFELSMFLQTYVLNFIQISEHLNINFSECVKTVLSKFPKWHCLPTWKTYRTLLLNLVCLSQPMCQTISFCRKLPVSYSKHSTLQDGGDHVENGDTLPLL